jgi:hypothetical protein
VLAIDWLMAGVMADVAEVMWLVVAVTRSIVAGWCAVVAGDCYIAGEWSRPST